MKAIATAALIATASLAAGSACAAEGLEIRFCPAKRVYTYPIQDAARIQSLVLQNLVVINRGPADVTLKSVRIDLLDKGAQTDTRRIEAAGLDAAVKSGARVKASGMMQMIAFQYCNGALLDGAVLSDDAVLARGEAVMVSRQMFAWRGARDTVRVHAEGSGAAGPVAVDASLPILPAESKTHFRFPLAGRWVVVVAATAHGGHRWALPEEFGLDIVRFGPNSTSYGGDGSRFTDYFAYGQPVLAAADGVVVSVKNDEPEDPKALRTAGEDLQAYGARVQQIQMSLLQRGAIAGDNVVIDHGAGEFSVSAHLKPGSVRVKPGQRVKAGDPIALLGSSGNSTEPHLHFQVCDAADTLNCAGIPITFDGIELPYADGPRMVQAGDIVDAK